MDGSLICKNSLLESVIAYLKDPLQASRGLQSAMHDCAFLHNVFLYLGSAHRILRPQNRP